MAPVDRDAHGRHRRAGLPFGGTLSSHRLAAMAAGPTTARRVALVHDFLLDVRGAERVFMALCDLFPDADLFTAVYDERGTEGRFAAPRVPSPLPPPPRPAARTV